MQKKEAQRLLRLSVSGYNLLTLVACKDADVPKIILRSQISKPIIFFFPSPKRDYIALKEAKLIFMKSKVAGEIVEVGYSSIHLMKETITITILQHPSLLLGVRETSQSN